MESKVAIEVAHEGVPVRGTSHQRSHDRDFQMKDCRYLPSKTDDDDTDAYLSPPLGSAVPIPDEYPAATNYRQALLGDWPAYVVTGALLFCELPRFGHTSASVAKRTHRSLDDL